MLRDIQFGVRMLWRDRTYAATAILTLAICIGANAAIFTIVHSVLLKPLPVPDSDRILQMSNQYPHMGATIFTGSAVPDYYDRLQGMNVYEEQAMYDSTGRDMYVNGSPVGVHGIEATPSLFRLLKVRPIQGRIFDESDGHAGNDLKVILSYGLWQQLYGADPRVIGREIQMGGFPRTIVGVMPPSFQFVDPQARFWIPLVFSDKQKSDDARHQNGWSNIGRLKPGATIQQAQQQVNAINASNLERFPQVRQLLIDAGFYTKVERLQDVLVQNVSRSLYLLWAGAALVLLIGAANLVNLALARSNVRLKELSTCLAIGASRARVAAEMVTESILLALTGGVLGILTGFVILRALTAIGLDQLPRANEIHMDWTVTGAALGLAILAGLVIGIVPFAHVFKVNVNAVLHEESRTGTQGRSAKAARRVLVVAQMALAFILLLASTLLIASFRNLLSSDPGFRPQNVITSSIWIPESRYPKDEAVRQFTSRLLHAVRAIPGVTVAGATTILPLSGNHDDEVIMAEGYQMRPGESVINPMQTDVTPGYFEAIGTPLVRGRFFDERDNETAPAAIIVDERVARKFWPDTDPIGKRMFIPADVNSFPTNEHTKWLTVVGVVREVRLQDLAQAVTFGAIYLPAAQALPRGLSVALKTAGNPAGVVKALPRTIQALDPEMPLPEVRTMDEYVALSLVQRKATMLLVTSFGVVSLLLSAIGLYGVLAFLVTQRFREIGIRVALGSTPGRIFVLVLREGFVLLAAGTIVGLLGTSWIQQVLQTQLYGLKAMDPIVISAVVFLFAVVALAACSIPARRATRVDPVTVLTLR